MVVSRLSSSLFSLNCESFFIELYSTPASIEIALQPAWQRRMVVSSTPILMNGRLDIDFLLLLRFKSNHARIQEQSNPNSSSKGATVLLASILVSPPTPASICRSDLISLVLAAFVGACRSLSAF
jgi:hypothetical protein